MKKIFERGLSSTKCSGLLYKKIIFNLSSDTLILFLAKLIDKKGCRKSLGDTFDTDIIAKLMWRSTILDQDFI